jgi:hypothetical protein
MEDLLTSNRTILKDVIRAQAQALAGVHDLSFKLEKGSFNRGQFRMVLKFGVPAIEQEMHQDFVQRYLPIVGLPLDVIGQSYTADGITYTIVDLSEKLDAKCMRVTRPGLEEGKRLKVSPRRIREGLGLPEPAEEVPEDDDGDADDI